MPSEDPGERPDLAAMLYPLVRALIAAEMPVLAAHEVSMWGYSVLTVLDETPVRTQAALAETIGADKSRIIGTLDELQDAGLIERTPDPDDRRVRLLSITTQGRRVRRSVRKDIRAREDRLLAKVPRADREAFLRVLRALHEARDATR
ncbi:MarR family winged helix-turn-helix transcriptional regulator [Kribbella sp. NBC_00359]|uniref:MarR family winged helix-turn-helix transcriptional regulator n=1 Tax=Kribbella sp. NBC_00359 TaxID=2975966 RepID=UPI002E247C46